MKLQRKVVLITGGRRLGAVFARQLAERGMSVALSYHQGKAEAEQTQAACRQLGVTAEIFQADLRSSAAAEQLVSDVVKSCGGLHVLLNLTSVYTPTPLDSLQPADYDDMLAANLSAPYYTALAAVRAMQRNMAEDGIQGKIIHLTDWAVQRPYRGFLPYLVAKGGLETLTRALAVEVAPSITVNAIAPGTVLPPVDLDRTRLEAIRESAALGKIGSPEDVAGLLRYLLEGTDFVTGEVFRVDGGRFLGPAESALSDH